MISKIANLFTQAERKRVLGLIFMILVMALIDTIGVASILPFLVVLNNPLIVEENAVILAVYRNSAALGIDSVEEFLLLLGVGAFLLTIFSLAFKAVTTVAQTRFSLEREYSLANRFVEGYWNQPYSFFLDRHSSDLAKTVLSEINVVVYQGIQPIMTILSQGAVILCLLALLLFVDPTLASAVCIVLGTTYFLIYFAMKRVLTRLGKIRTTANEARYKILSEAFASAKEVKMSALEKHYIDRFSAASEKYTSGQISATIIGQLPRFLLEAVAFGGMLLVIIYQMATTGEFSDTLPVIGLYSVAGYKILPAIQQVYLSATQIRFVSSALDSLLKELPKFKSTDTSIENEKELDEFLQGEIIVKDLDFRYQNTTELALKGINLSVGLGASVGIVGETGSGKTTLVDIILGLLIPQQGVIEIGGVEISSKNRITWQRSIGYVPQQICLMDDSIVANIALGIPEKDVDLDEVVRAATIAECYDFISDELPNGFQTVVGERGARLSGGQRQRIGIARAIYRRPRILILDEATSALDALTEKKLLRSIKDLSEDTTTIMITHRLETLHSCDCIFLLDKGAVIDQGSYDELKVRSEKFMQLLNKSPVGQSALNPRER